MIKLHHPNTYIVQNYYIYFNLSRPHSYNYVFFTFESIIQKKENVPVLTHPPLMIISVLRVLERYAQT